MVDSRRVLCCGARTWALVIGWLQTVFSAIALVLFILRLVFLFTGKDELTQEVTRKDRKHDITGTGKAEENRTFIIIVMCTAIVIVALGLIAGIFLIVGVKQKSPAKLQTWIVIEGVFVALSFVVFGIRLEYGGPSEMLIETLVSISTSIFFIWVVSIYRQEVLNAGAGAGDVSYGFVRTA